MSIKIMDQYIKEKKCHVRILKLENLLNEAKKVREKIVKEKCGQLSGFEIKEEDFTCVEVLLGKIAQYKRQRKQNSQTIS